MVNVKVVEWCCECIYLAINSMCYLLWWEFGLFVTVGSTFTKVGGGHFVRYDTI